MSAPTFTASEIAPALGKNKRSVQLALAKVRRDGVKIVRGQQADAWQFGSLPCRYVQELGAIASRRGYHGPEHLLSDPPRRFLPVDKNGKAVAVPEIAEIHVQKATQRRDALALSLSLRDRLTSADSKQLALASFRSVLGNASEETWNRWLKRVIQRDAGAERFDDLALYFEGVVCRKPEARDRIAIGSTAAERTLLSELAAPKNPMKPTLIEKAKIWEAVCHFIDDAMASDVKQKRAIRRVLELISGSRVQLASSEYRLRRNVKEKFLCWSAQGRTFAALEDKRPANSGPPRAIISVTDRHKITGHTGINCGNRIAQGYRELRDNGELSFELTNRHISNPASKSYVPKSVRAAVKYDIERISNYHRGPHEHRLKGAHINRDWSGVAAGDAYQADDLTPPVYFRQREASGEKLTRGQLLPMIDVVSDKILGCVLIQAETYNSLSIFQLCVKVFKEHGLPRRALDFERGIWKNSRLISGRADTDLQETADLGFRRLGIELNHARLARSKVIERTLGLFQNLMEGFSGYCGRNEQTEKHERLDRLKLDVKAGRVDASRHLHSAEDLVARYCELIEIHNNEPQEGRLKGLSPNEAWDHWQGVEPRAYFDPSIHYFLASDLRRLKIGRNGLTITVGKKRFNYKGEETGKRQGETVFAWWDPASPDLLTCTTDLNGSGVFTVERAYDVPARDASREQLAEANRQINEHQRYAPDLYRIVKNSLPPSAFRGRVVAPSVVKLGEEMAAQQGRKRKQRAEVTQLSDRRRRVAQAGGINPGIIRLDPGAIESAEKLSALKERVRKRLDEEAAEQDSGSGNMTKTYVLDGPPKTLSPQQRKGMYWRLWKAAESASPNLNRFALTSRVLGAVKKIELMTDEEFLKVCRVFESIARKGSQV